MALGDVIARLAVNLSLNTVAFEKGADKSEKRLNQMRRQFSDTAKKFAVGAAAIGAAAGATIAVFRDMAHQAIDSAKQIEDLSSVANASTDQFQKAAFAARSVGIESEKLADIYKDVNDKIGDFAATGGGAMADFFENIAPKVGVTAESFKDLSGPDALQLYVSSLEKAGVNQQEMVFYMEALASDATALLPLLKDNGKAMGEFAAEAERLGLVMSSEEIAKAKEVANNLALLNAQVEAKQNKKMLEHADAILQFEEGISTLKLALIEAVVEVQNFGAFLDEGTQRTHENLVTIRRAVEDFGGRVIATFKAIPDTVSNFVSRMVQMGSDLIAGLVRGIKAGGTRVADAITGIASDAVTRAKNFLGIKSPSRVFMEIGGFIAEGMAMGIIGGVGAVGSAAKAMTDAARAAAMEVLSIIQRLYPEMAKLDQYKRDVATLEGSTLSDDAKAEAKRRLGYEYRGGRAEPSASTIDAGPTIDFEKVKESMGDFGGVLKDTADKAKTQTVRIAESFKDMAEKTLQSFSGLVSAIKGGGFLDILESAVGLFLNLAGSGVFGSGLAGKVNSVPGYATGTNSAARGWAWVGERGPELVNFSGGERVMNHRDSMNAGRAGGNTYHFSGNLMTPEFWARIEAGDMQAAQGGAQLAGQQMQFQRSRRLA